MQIIESSNWGVRSARLAFRHPITDQTVTLFPMIHIGEQAFYDLVYREACAHEVILVEGVRSPITKRVTRSYRWIGDKLGLVVQPKHPASDLCQASIVHADLSGEAFEILWAGLPRWQRCLIAVAAPVIGLRRRWFGTRKDIASHLGMDDAKSRNEWLRWSPETAMLGRVLLGARDEKLIDTLSEQLTTHSSIAIVYGAAHMRAVLRELTDRRGFTCVDSEWMLVFAL